MSAAALAARLRDAARGRAALPAVGTLEETQDRLDALLVVAEVSAALAEAAVAGFALRW